MFDVWKQKCVFWKQVSISGNEKGFSFSNVLRGGGAPRPTFHIVAPQRSLCLTMIACSLFIFLPPLDGIKEKQQQVY
jgi:hypothetical protein